MDSGNSNSLQSSSGGVDDDNDSRNESISSYLNQNPNPNILQSPQTLNHTNLSPVFDPHWSIPSPTFTSFDATQNNDVFINSQQDMYSLNPNSNSNSNSNTSHPMSSNANMGRSSDHNPIGVSTKNPKKRTRASRRAPTRVIKTDTTNFRQMVQEFTGNPVSPLTAATSSPYSRRLDLFSGGLLGPLYPLRPSVHTTLDGSSSNSYQIPLSNIQGLQTQPQTLVELQSPLFSFQSLLQEYLPQRVNVDGTMLGTSTRIDIDGHQQVNGLNGFNTSSLTRWSGVNENNLVNFDGVSSNILKADGCKLNSLENGVLSRNSDDKTQGNVDSWLCPSEN